MKYLVFIILILFLLLYFITFQLWIPEKHQNSILINDIKDLESRIEVFNEKNKIYANKIAEFKKHSSENESYKLWADSLVHPDMLELLQK